jgi:hypothetical protein
MLLGGENIVTTCKDVVRLIHESVKTADLCIGRQISVLDASKGVGARDR